MKKPNDKEEFMSILSSNNVHYNKEHIVLITEYEDMNTEMYVDTRYGLCKTKPLNLLKGSPLSIRLALDKNEYYSNMAKNVHGDRYIYDNIDYTGAHNYISITCKKHGDFSMRASAHLDKRGCPLCGIGVVGDMKNSKARRSILDIETIKERVSKKSPSVEILDNNYTPNVKIKCRCRICGNIWKVTSNGLTAGRRCPSCANMKAKINISNRYNNANKCNNEKIDCTLYVIKCNSETESFYKIGITRKNVFERFKYSYMMPYNYSTVLEYSSNLYECTKLENYFHNEFFKYSYEPTIKFGGWTECFDSIDESFVKNTLFCKEV